jgi:hypothetical protein
MYNPVVVPVLLIVTVNATSEFAVTSPGVTLALQASAAQTEIGRDNHAANKIKTVNREIKFDGAARCFIYLHHT